MNKTRSRLRRKRPNRPLRWLASVGVIVSIVYLACLVLLRSRRNEAGYMLMSGLVDIAGVAWTFWIGSAFGSFLNVVAWRLPRGKSVGGRSHCPYCDTAILARDNVPVFGWLALRGRCRTCHLPISSRYPIVELAVGLSLMTAALVIMYRGQGYLPLGAPYTGSNWPLRLAELGWPEYLAMAYYFVTLAGLWGFGLVRIDEFRVPMRLFAGVSLIAIGLPLALPFLQPLPWQFSIPPTPLVDTDQGMAVATMFQSKVWRGHRSTDALMYAVCAFGCGIFLTRLAGRFLFPHADLKLDPLGRDSAALVDVCLSWSIAGVLIGWQSLIGAFPLIILSAAILARWLPNRQHAGRILLVTPIVLVAVFAFWPYLVKQIWWPSPGHPAILYLIYSFIGWSLASLCITKAKPSEDEISNNNFEN